MSPDSKTRNETSATELIALRKANDQIDSWTQRLVRRLAVNRGAGRMVVALLAAVALFTVLNPRVFLSPINLQNIAIAARCIRASGPSLQDGPHGSRQS